jgi:hypothetical protein
MAGSPVPEAILLSCLRKAFGAGCRLKGGIPLAGGTRKQVWRFSLEGPGPQDVVLLAWHNLHDYFNELGNEHNTLNDQNAPELYRVNTELLLTHGLRVPLIYVFDDSRMAVPYAFALVEYIQALTFRKYRAERTEAEMRTALERMGAYFDGLGAITRGYSGTILEIKPGPVDYPDQVMAETLPDLEGLARVHPGVGMQVEAIRARLNGLRAIMIRRDRFSFVHGELGPDEHLLIDPNRQVVVLDIDACQFAEVEREHAYLKLRFNVYEQAFRRPDLGPVRMDFYELCLHIMSAYGHYLLLSQGYPGAEELRRIYEWNAERVLR